MSDIDPKWPVVFTAQSKVFFYCRDAVCEYTFRMGAVPINPFRVFEYFLGDRVDRDLVRRGNNDLIRTVDELWVFGDSIADGVLAEIRLARTIGKPIRFFSIGTTADAIHPVDPTRLSFERQVYTRTRLTRSQLLGLVLGHDLPDQLELAWLSKS